MRRRFSRQVLELKNTSNQLWAYKPEELAIYSVHETEPPNHRAAGPPIMSVSIVLCALLTGATLLLGLSSPRFEDSSPEQRRLEQARNLVQGATLELPAEELDRVRALGRTSILIGRTCSSCNSDLNLLRREDLRERISILVVPSSRRAFEHEPMRAALQKTDCVVFDPLRRVFPSAIYEIAPLLVDVEWKGKRVVVSSVSLLDMAPRPILTTEHPR